MTITRPSEMTAEERQEIFHETYGNELDAGVGLGALVQTAGLLLRKILPEHDVDAGMEKMLAPYLGAQGSKEGESDEGDNWITALKQSSFTDCFSEWPMGEVLHDLTAYALYGFVPHDGDRNEREQYLLTLMANAEDFYALAPTELWSEYSEENDLSQIDFLMSLVRGRWALDNMQPISPTALAYFGGRSEGRIRNLMSGKDRMFHADEGMIPANEALDWLEKQETFYPSIWKTQSIQGYFNSEAQAPEKWDEVWFVPVARDGTIFSPGLAKKGEFTIGPKGSENQKPDYETALSELQKMEIPYWRRPNAQGNWGIVRGAHWVRLSGQDLKRFQMNPTLKVMPND